MFTFCGSTYATSERPCQARRSGKDSRDLGFSISLEIPPNPMFRPPAVIQAPYPPSRSGLPSRSSGTGIPARKARVGTRSTVRAGASEMPLPTPGPKKIRGT